MAMDAALASLVLCEGSFTVAAGVITASALPNGCSVVKTSTGLYTLTYLAGPFTAVGFRDVATTGAFGDVTKITVDITNPATTTIAITNKAYTDGTDIAPGTYAVGDVSGVVSFVVFLRK